MQLRNLVVVLVTLAACGDDGSPAGDGGPGDTMIVVDVDNGSCGDTVRLTGEYVDWDDDSHFCGINEAVFEVPGGQMDSTAPNGRFDLCIPDQPATRLAITQPTVNSQCTVPPSNYTLPTILYARKDVIRAGGFYDARSWTVDRETRLFPGEVGAAIDPAKAHLHVRVDGNARAVSISAAHGTALAIAVGSTTWAPGTTGRDVFFPNIDVGSGETTLTVTGGAVGTGTVPLVAGTLTNVTVLAP